MCLFSDIWTDKEEISCILREERIFHPSSNEKYKENLSYNLEEWLKVHNTY